MILWEIGVIELFSQTKLFFGPKASPEALLTLRVNAMEELADVRELRPFLASEGH